MNAVMPQVGTSSGPASDAGTTAVPTPIPIILCFSTFHYAFAAAVASNRRAPDRPSKPVPLVLFIAHLHLLVLRHEKQEKQKSID